GGGGGRVQGGEGAGDGALPGGDRGARPAAVAPGAGVGMSHPPRFVSHGLVWLHRRLRRAVDRLAPPELVLSERITGVQQTGVAGLLGTSGVARPLAGEAPPAGGPLGPPGSRARAAGRPPPRAR